MKLGVTWKQQLGRPECPYAERWVLNLHLFSVRLHHFRRSDDARAFHDHPWFFVTLVLRGSYIDRSPSGDDLLRPGSIRFRPALHRHTIVTDGVWTLTITLIISRSLVNPVTTSVGALPCQSMSFNVR